MQINQNHKNPSFGSKKLYNVALKTQAIRNSGEKLNAVFSRLTELDKDYINFQKNTWNQTKYGSTIINDFINTSNDFLKKNNNRTKFYAVERFNPKSTKEEIYGLAEVTENPNYFQISYLQSSSKVPDFSEKVKGVGQMLLYGIVQLAKKAKKKYIMLESTANNFYTRSGWKNCGKSSDTCTTFALDAEDFDNFLKTMEYKYKFRP